MTLLDNPWRLPKRLSCRHTNADTLILLASYCGFGYVLKCLNINSYTVHVRANRCWAKWPGPESSAVSLSTTSKFSRGECVGMW